MPVPDSYLAPLTDELLRLGCKGLDIGSAPRVLDLCCGNGVASRFMAVEFGAHCTGIDMSEDLLRQGREQALAAGLQEQLDFVNADARHVELPNHSFDLVLALGGTLTYTGRPEGLERIRQLLKPGGSLLLSDLIYLDSPIPDAVSRFLEEKAPDNEVRPLALEPAVRAVFEEGVYRFETEASYQVLLETFGLRTRFAFPVPESAWNRYYNDVCEALLDPASAGSMPVCADELAAFYSWGGRWGVGYLICGATLPAEDA